MICIKNREELNSAPPEIKERVSSLLGDEGTFEYLLGGYVYIIEEKMDLMRIEGYDFEFADVYGRWPCPLDKVITVDGASKISEDYGEVFMLNNNSGGPLFYIPKKLWEDAKFEELLRENN